MTEKQEQIIIEQVTAFGGQPVPRVETFADVDIEMLTNGDPDPLYVTMQVLETGRTSKNGLHYDDQLADWVTEQIAAKRPDALMGHLSDADRASMFPVSSSGNIPHAGFWVGVEREGSGVWAKAYIPQGDVRDYIRSRKAVGGKLGTSIYGMGNKTRQPDGSVKLTSFDLETLDFAPHDRASLKLGGEFTITAETHQSDDQLSEELNVMTNLAIPDEMRQQIITEALQAHALESSASRVAELTNQLTERDTRIAELEAAVSNLTETVAEQVRNTEIVSSIRAVFGGDSEADIAEAVAALHRSMTDITEELGADYANVSVSVSQLNQMVREMQQAQHEGAINSAVAELVNWNVATEAGRNQLDALRGQIAKSVLRELPEPADPIVLAETVQTVYEADFAVIAEALRDSMGGPAAVVAGKVGGVAQPGTADYYKTETARRELRRKFQ